MDIFDATETLWALAVFCLTKRASSTPQLSVLNANSATFPAVLRLGVCRTVWIKHCERLNDHVCSSSFFSFPRCHIIQNSLVIGPSLIKMTVVVLLAPGTWKYMSSV